MKKKYWLRQWVYVANCDEHLVFLDILHDKYFLLSGEEARLAQSAIYSDGHADTNCSDESGHSGCVTDIVAEMLATGLITDRREAGKPMSQCSIERPVNQFEHTESDVEPPVRWHHVLNVIVLGIVLHLALRVVPLRFILKYLSQRENIRSQAENEHISLRMAALYRNLRPFLFRSRLCLYDTTVFASFCRIYGFSPAIVFGVKGEPFEAHCWAQSGSLILNDAPQHTGQYIPIMVI